MCSSHVHVIFLYLYLANKIEIKGIGNKEKSSSIQRGHSHWRLSFRFKKVSNKKKQNKKLRVSTHKTRPQNKFEALFFLFHWSEVQRPRSFYSQPIAAAHKQWASAIFFFYDTCLWLLTALLCLTSIKHSTYYSGPWFKHQPYSLHITSQCDGTSFHALIPPSPHPPFPLSPKINPGSDRTECWLSVPCSARLLVLYMIMKNSGRDVACLVRRVTGEHSFAAIRRSTFKLL